MSEMVDPVNLTGSRLSQETTLVTAVGECLDCEKPTLWVAPSYGLGFKTE